MNYQFEVVRDKNLLQDMAGTSKLCDIYDYFNYTEDLQDKMLLAVGQLKHLFGEPLYVTENLEDQFMYLIKATDENGKERLLSAYGGPSGPSIGGNANDKSSVMAAPQLAEYIRGAKADDYDYKGYYLDGPCVVENGVKNGVPYNKEEQLELSAEELAELIKRVRG